MAPKKDAKPAAKPAAAAAKPAATAPKKSVKKVVKLDKKALAKKVAEKSAPKTAAKTAAAKEPEIKKAVNLFVAKPRNFGIGGAIRPRRDLTRYVKWPKYVRLQRQRRILYQRLKVPPAINQFSFTVEKNHATQLFKLLDKYKPEDRAAKKQRLLKVAEAKTKGETVEAPKKPLRVECGINHITSLVEQKKAQLVVIAHDVDPIELVVWLPTLCRKKGVPYCIVKGKSRLGQVIGKKTATAVAITTVKPEDKQELSNIINAVKLNEKYDEIRKVWGGGKLGSKSTARLSQKQKAISKERVRA
jgi:large subunit ribosomal protein L7Ae